MSLNSDNTTVYPMIYVCTEVGCFYCVEFVYHMTNVISNETDMHDIYTV